MSDLFRTRNPEPVKRTLLLALPQIHVALQLPDNLARILERFVDEVDFAPVRGDKPNAAVSSSSARAYRSELPPWR